MNKVLSVLLLIIVIILTAGCRHPKNRVPVFVNEAFQDSLENFSNSVGDYSDSFESPTIVSIYISARTEKNDTTVLFFVSDYPLLKGGVFKGGQEINGRLCLVKYFGIDSIPSVINESSLSFKRRDYNSFYTIWDCEDGEYSYKTYKLHGTDSLQILDRCIGETENGYNPNGINRVFFK